MHTIRILTLEHIDIAHSHLPYDTAAFTMFVREDIKKDHPFLQQLQIKVNSNNVVFPDQCLVFVADVAKVDCDYYGWVMSELAPVVMAYYDRRILKHCSLKQTDYSDFFDFVEESVLLWTIVPRSEQ